MTNNNEDMVILKRETKFLKTVYTVKVPDTSKIISDRDLLELCDSPFGAPFGGEVEKRNESTYIVTVYAD